MNGEREPHASTNKVSEQTLHDLVEVLDKCKWVEKKGYEELAPADRDKTNPTLHRLVEEVNVSTIGSSPWQCILLTGDIANTYEILPCSSQMPATDHTSRRRYSDPDTPIRPRVSLVTKIAQIRRAYTRNKGRRQNMLQRRRDIALFKPT